MKSTKNSKLYLVDSLNLIFRSVLSPGPDLRSPTGESTKGPYIFTKALLRIINTPNLTHLAIALDAPRESLERKKIFPEYKAQRKSDPDPEIGKSISRCFEILYSMDLPLFKSPGYEADDIIGSLAMLANDDLKIVVVSTDKDLHQLVTPNVSVFDPMKDVLFDVETVCKHWNIRFPKQVCDFKMLVGDASDNYKGVNKVGTVLATKVLQEVDTAEDILKYTGKINAGAKQGIEEADFTVLRSLAEIKTDLHVVNTADDLMFTGWKIPDKTKLIFEELGFRRWAE